MKIDGPGKTQQSGSAKKSQAKRTGDGAFGDLLKGPDGAGGAGATQSVARVDALLAVQGAEDPTARAARRRMRERGENILNELEKIRLALLTGTMTVGHVLAVADLVASHRERVTDPEMTALLDEIDLRAQIEIAKLRKAMETHAGI